MATLKTTILNTPRSLKDDPIYEGHRKASKLLNEAKSLPVNESIKLLKLAGYDVKREDRHGYRDKKAPGAQYVTSRKEVKYYTVTVSKDGKEIRTFNNEMSMHTAYSLTSFVQDVLDEHIKNNKNVEKAELEDVVNDLEGAYDKIENLFEE